MNFLKIKNKKIINLHKYLIFSFFVFVLFFISTFVVHSSTNILTKNATNVTDIGAKLWGAMNPGSLTKVYFRYSPLDQPPVFCNDIYGSRMKATDEVQISGNSTQEIGLGVANLLPDTIYYFCIVSSTSSQIAYGGVKLFQTKQTPSTINGTNNEIFSAVTQNALVVDSTSAYLNGSYSATTATQSYFLYRKYGDANWQTTKLGLQQNVANTSNDISYLLKQLSPSTSYQFKTILQKSSPLSGTTEGNISTFTTKSVGTIIPGTTGPGTPYTPPCANTDSDTNCNGTGTTDIGTDIETIPVNLVLGQTNTPPIDATVHYREGIETVFTRQIMANAELAKTFGYQEGTDLQTFAWNLSDLLAKTFGYINRDGKEIRVSKPDIAAYQLYLNNGILTVYEYYNSKIVNIQKTTDVLRNKYYYEYYFKK